MPTSVIDSLAAELPEGTVVTDPDILESYRQDRAADPQAGTPIAVVRPRRTEEVQTVLRWATVNRIAVVPRGMGTGLSGGATAVNGGIVLSTEKMRDITVDRLGEDILVAGQLNMRVATLLDGKELRASIFESTPAKTDHRTRHPRD